MGERNATFVECDRCDAESCYKSPQEAHSYSVQIEITGMKIPYLPQHAAGDPRSFICRECAHELRDWWREKRTAVSDTDKERGE